MMLHRLAFVFLAAISTVCALQDVGQCETRADCPRGKVCLRNECVCGGLCRLLCPYGNEENEFGCPVCKCKSAPAVQVAAPAAEEAVKQPDGAGPIAAGQSPAQFPGLVSGSDQHRCGPVCYIFCPYGNVQDEFGCPICKCNPAPEGNLCSGATCRMYCEHGFEVDDDGCEICVCKANTCATKADCGFGEKCEDGRCVSCGPICLIGCEFGLVEDKDGCPICDCKPAPV